MLLDIVFIYMPLHCKLLPIPCRKYKYLNPLEEYKYLTRPILTAAMVGRVDNHHGNGTTNGPAIIDNKELSTRTGRSRSNHNTLSSGDGRGSQVTAAFILM